VGVPPPHTASTGHPSAGPGDGTGKKKKSKLPFTNVFRQLGRGIEKGLGHKQ
jgi:hypothetical protein